MSKTNSFLEQSRSSARPKATGDAYPLLHGAFRWRVPARMNIAQLCCQRWALEPPSAARIALRWEHADGSHGQLSYAQLQQQADRLSHALHQLGVRRGDRVAIVMPQRPQTAVTHMALYQLGAVAVPLSNLFGIDALVYRLQDSACVCAVVDETAIDHLRLARPQCPVLHSLVVAGAALPSKVAGAGECGWAAVLAAAPDGLFGMADTAAEDPAVLVYTSGTTGPSKGALIPHRALIGNLTGFVCSQNWFGADGDEVFWSPADWAWTGGLMDALLPTLYFGRCIVASQTRFDPVAAFELMQRHAVTHSFLFPTALKAMMKAVPQPLQRYRLQLRAVMSAGEAVGDAVFHWCQHALGVTVNEMFGQTEVNYIVGNCGSYVDAKGQRQPAWPAKAGSMGRAYPGHRVAVVDEEGQECPRGTPGDVAVHRLDIHGEPDPVFFLGYWGNDAATRKKFTGDMGNSWCRTGDMAIMDDEGYLWYQGRSDDMFKAAGYRIGPSEVENCLVKHPAVANAAVVPKPDAERGAVVKAYVVLAPDQKPSASLVQDLQRHVRGLLAPYEYPKEIEFVDSLPMTTTGKVQRRVLRLQEVERARQP